MIRSLRHSACFRFADFNKKGINQYLKLKKSEVIGEKLANSTSL